MEFIDRLMGFRYTTVARFIELLESHKRLSSALDVANDRLRECIETMEKQEVEKRLLRREIEEKTRRLEQIEAGLAQRMESMTIVRPGQYGGNSTFSVEIYVSYEMFEQAIDNAGVRRMSYEYDMMFNSLFRTIREKFDALLSLGPKAWTMKPARRYNPYGQSAMEFYDE